MISRGLIVWLVSKYLAEETYAQRERYYGLEYSTALLMNLCLHSSGKDQCLPIANTALTVLVDLVALDVPQVTSTWIITLTN